MATDYITRSEASEREAAIRREMDVIRQASERRDGELAARLARVETAQDRLDEWTARFDARFDARMDDISDRLGRVETAVRRWLGFEKLAIAGIGGVVQLPLLRWLKRLLRWGLTALAVATGAALGVALTVILMTLI